MPGLNPHTGAPVALQLRLLGPLAIHRDGQPLVLPPSRKVRGLIAYLALAPHAPARQHLCELLWDLPNDPRGELRWCLSKMRALLDEPGLPRVLSEGEQIRLDLRGCRVDALEVQAAAQAGLATLDAARLRALSGAFAGDFLEGLEIGRSAPFSAWLLGQRRRLRATHAALLERLAQALPPAADERIGCLERWLQLAPFDRRAHELLLDALARRGALREGDEHLATTARLFEAEGQDWAPLGLAWRDAKARHAAAPRAAPDAGAPALIGPGIAPGSGPVPATAATAAAAAADALRHRASLAVMPFTDTSRAPGVRGGLADGLVYDVITRLAKLRSVLVIAQGTVFALDERRIGPEDAARALNVDYVASGTLRRSPGRVSVDVQLSETRSARIVWADTLAAQHDDPFAVLDEIGNRIVASIAGQIELAERNRAILKPPGSLDAWEAHHRGLWHMYRFNREDNLRARQCFEAALALDPTFSRPYAGLSFTHFENAFLGWADRDEAIEAAYRSAAQGVLVDEYDPATHWALGRALWLGGRLDESLAELGTSVDLSPNFALGHYTLSFVNAQSGDPLAAIASGDHSRQLSPFDPLLFAMLASRALALVRLGRFDEAAEWACKGATRPNAHVHIQCIAAHCLALAGRVDEARRMTAAIHRRQPGYRVDDFLLAFRFADDAQALIRRAARVAGLA